MSRLLGSFAEVERRGEDAADEFGDSRLLRGPRAGDVESLDVVLREKGQKFFRQAPDRGSTELAEV